VRRCAGFLLPVLTAAALGSAGAQSGTPRELARRPQLTVGIGATYGNLVGGDFRGSKAGVGFDANVGVVLRRRWQLGLGYDRTNHGHEDTDGDYVVSNVYVEPRLLFENPSRAWTPYAAVRLGRAMASFQGVLGITDKGSGHISGLGAGVLLRLARMVQSDVAVHYDRLSHDYGTGGYADAERGGRLSVRAGIQLATRP
jgi:hypothetical protein